MLRSKIVAFLATVSIVGTGLAVATPTAGALACTPGASCDAYSLNLAARRNGIAANGPAWASQNKQAADANAARGNHLGANLYRLASSSYFTAAADINGNGSRDIDEALIYITAYGQQANRSSAQALGYLQSAENLVTSAEQWMAAGGSYNLQATQVTNTWTANLASPFGSFDRVEPYYNFLTGRFDRLSIQGWAIDPDSTGPVTVRVYTGPIWPAPLVATVVADKPRPDVGAAYPPYGNNHGFSTLVPWPGSSSATVCLTGVNISTGQDREIGCKTVAVPNEWQRTNLHTTVYGQSIHDMVGGFLNPASSSGVLCRNLPASFRPAPTLPANTPVFYDCRSAGTVNRAKANTYMKVSVPSTTFVWDAGTGNDVYKSLYRVDLIGKNGGFGDPQMADTDEAKPNLPTTMAGAWGAVDLLTRYSNVTTKLYRATKFRQMYGVEANGKVWSWKIPTQRACYQESLTIHFGVFPWSTTEPVAC